MVTDLCEITVDLEIGKAEHAQSPALKNFSALFIAGLPVLCIVLGAVSFYHQLCGGAIEIYDEAVDYDLTLKLGTKVP